MPELTSPIPLEKCPFRGCNRPGKLYRFKEPGNPNNLGYTYYQVVCDNPPEKDHRGCRHRDPIAAVEEWNGEDGIAGHFSPGNKQGGKKQLPTTGDKVKEGVIVLIILLAFAGTVGGLFIKEWFSAFLCFVIMIMEYKEYKKLDNRKDVPFKEGKIKCGVKPDTGKPTPTEPPPGADGKHPLPVNPKEITQFNGGTNRPPIKPKPNRPPPATNGERSNILRKIYTDENGEKKIRDVTQEECQSLDGLIVRCVPDKDEKIHHGNSSMNGRNDR